MYIKIIYCAFIVIIYNVFSVNVIKLSSKYLAHTSMSLLLSYIIRWPDINKTNNIKLPINIYTYLNINGY